MKTVGISPKAVLAFLLPAIGTLILAVLDQVLSPAMDPSLKVAIVGLANSVLAFAGAYAGNPGAVVDVRSSWGATKSGTSNPSSAAVFTTPHVVGARVTSPVPEIEESSDPDALPDYDTTENPPPDEGDTHARPEPTP